MSNDNKHAGAMQTALNSDAQPDEIVGHKTFATPEGGFRHEPLLKSEADAIMAAAEIVARRRKEMMPTEQDAARMMLQAHLRLKELGWRETCYGPTNEQVQLIEPGSSGIHSGIRWNPWPETIWWIDGDAPSHPIFFKPLPKLDATELSVDESIGKAIDQTCNVVREAGKNEYTEDELNVICDQIYLMFARAVPSFSSQPSAQPSDTPALSDERIVNFAIKCGLPNGAIYEDWESENVNVRPSLISFVRSIFAAAPQVAQPSAEAKHDFPNDVAHRYADLACDLKRLILNVHEGICTIDDAAERANRYMKSARDFQESFGKATPPTVDQSQDDLSDNAQWLTTAHMICTDQGVPQGNIKWRLEVLQGLLSQDDGAVKDAEIARLNAIIDTPQSGDFLRAVSIEAEHQRQRWGADGDAGKAPSDWFWLIGYLAGKALHAHAAGDMVKGEHHIITTAAACQNWHAAMFGSTDMRPGIAASKSDGAVKP